MHHPKLAKSDLLPVFLLLFSASMWGLIWYPLRILEHHGLSGLWSTLIMYAAALIPALFLLTGRWREFAQHPWLLLLIALGNAWCNVAFILAVLDGTVVRVLLLFYLSPLWATLLGMLLLGERLNRTAVLTLAIALIGALIMLWEPEYGMPWPKDRADWLALSAGVGFAFSNVLVRKLSHVSVRVKAASTWIGVSVLAVIWIVVSGTPVPAVEFTVVGGAALLGVLGIASMTLAVLYGVSHMPVHRSSVILLFEIVVGAVSSLLLTDEVVLPREWIGGVLIILAAYLSTRDHLNERAGH
ncbi:MAG: DMT family transporter [Pseudomonadota bacterium]